MPWPDPPGPQAFRVFLLQRLTSAAFLQKPVTRLPVAVQLLSRVQLCNPTDYSMPCCSVLHCLPEFAQTHIRLVSDAIQPSHPLSSPSPALRTSQHQGLCNELVLCIKWPKYWSFSFSFSISPSNEYSGSISFRIDWFDLLAVQGTLKIFSSATIQKHQFSGAQPSLWSSSHIHAAAAKSLQSLSR